MIRVCKSLQAPKGLHSGDVTKVVSSAVQDIIQRSSCKLLVSYGTCTWRCPRQFP